MKQSPLRVQSSLPTPRLKKIPISAISPSPSLVRAVDGEELSRLTESVRRHGLIQPVGVRKKPGFPARYELLFGYRRFLACRALFLPSIPCLVFPDRRECALLSLCENFQRRTSSESELRRAAARLSLPLDRLCARLPLPCPEEENTAKVRDISVFLEERLPRPDADAEAGFRRGIVRDPRLVANSIERAVSVGRDAGVTVDLQKVQREREIWYHIRLPICRESGTVLFTEGLSRVA
ncbi:MAG: ParB/RepB/Spo0J family partition protein [Clostridia bacterium]|nr:ParB/RepB/Spo0J family partition protein [Clostridia bacterium]